MKNDSKQFIMHWFSMIKKGRIKGRIKQEKRPKNNS